MDDQIPVVNNKAAHSFEMTIEGRQVFIDYRKRDDVYLLVHTEVPQELQGQGIAANLVEKTFNYLEERNLKMLPYCEYIQAYLKRHPQWDKLIAK